MLTVGGSETGIAVARLFDAVPVDTVGGQAGRTAVHFFGNDAVEAQEVLHRAVSAPDPGHVLIVFAIAGVKAEELVIAVCRAVSIEFKCEGGIPVAVHRNLNDVTWNLGNVLFCRFHATLAGNQADPLPRNDCRILLSGDLKLISIVWVGEIDIRHASVVDAGNAGCPDLAAASAGKSHHAGVLSSRFHCDDTVIPIVPKGFGLADLALAVADRASLDSIAILGTGGGNHTDLHIIMRMVCRPALHRHGGGALMDGTVNIDIGIMGIGPDAVYFLNTVVHKADSTVVNRDGKAGSRAAVVVACAGIVMSVLLVPHVVHTAAVRIGEIDGLILWISGISPRGATSVGAVHDLIARLEDDVSHRILIVVVTPDPDDVGFR